jgi:hypothetical protein
MEPARRLADEIRRVIESLQRTDLGPDECDAYADSIARVADDLATKPHRDSWHHNTEVGLEVVFTPSNERRWANDERAPYLGTLNPAAPPMTIAVVETDQGPRLRGDVTLSATYEGAPLTAHGGVVAGLMDDMLGNAQRVAEVAGYTGTLKVIFRAPTPTYTPLQLEAWVERIDGRKIFLLGTLHAGETLCAEAEGIYIKPVF